MVVVSITVIVDRDDEFAVILGPVLDKVVATFEDVLGFSSTAIPSPYSASTVCSILSISVSRVSEAAVDEVENVIDCGLGAHASAPHRGQGPSLIANERAKKAMIIRLALIVGTKIKTDAIIE